MNEMITGLAVFVALCFFATVIIRAFWEPVSDLYWYVQRKIFNNSGVSIIGTIEIEEDGVKRLHVLARIRDRYTVLPPEINRESKLLNIRTGIFSKQIRIKGEI